MDRAIALAALKTGLEAGTVQPKDKSFVESLVAQSAALGLSDKQWYWVVKLAVAITGEQPQTRAIGEFSRVYTMFQKAKEHLKYPKVILQMPSGREVKIYLSGERSRLPDTVNVVSNDSDEWYGRVFSDGRWDSGNRPHTNVVEVEDTLKSFANNPEEVAAAHGKLTGNCCFCHRPLTDERSTDVGYGPVCARNFNLRWGSKKAK